MCQNIIPILRCEDFYMLSSKTFFAKWQWWGRVWRGSRSSKDGWAPSETESGIQIQVCVFSLQILRLSALCGQIWQIFWGVMTLGRQVKSSPNFSSFGQQRAEKRNIWRGKHTNLNLNSGLCSEKKEMPVLDAELLWELLYFRPSLGVKKCLFFLLLTVQSPAKWREL